jgi:hypothetical protein
MKRLLSIVLLLLVVFVPCTYADTIVLNQAGFDLVPNFLGENVSFAFSGPRAEMSGIGTINASWSNGFDFSGLDAGLLPGSSLTPSAYLYIDFVEGSVIIGGQTLTLCFDCLGRSYMTALGSFQFPTNGASSFTATVPAMLGPTSGHGEGPDGTFDAFQVILPRGSLTLTFDLVPAQDPYPAYYQFSRGEFFGTTVVPEPATLLLFGTGLTAIGWRKFRTKLSA